MPTKDDPRITVRIDRELHRRLKAASERDGLPIGLHVRSALKNYLEPGPQHLLTTPARREEHEVAVEQALGNRGGPSSGEPSGDEADSPSGRAPTPAEPPEEPYVPEWKQRTAYTRPLTSAPIPKKS